MWPGMYKLPKIARLLFLCNVLRKKQVMKLIFLHADKHERYLQTDTMIFHGCSNHSSLEMEAECVTKTLSYLNLNMSRTKNGRNKL